MKGDDPRRAEHPGIVSIGDGMGQTLVDLENAIVIDRVHLMAYEPVGGPDALAMEITGTINPHDDPIRILCTLGSSSARKVVAAFERVLEGQMRWKLCERKKPLGRRVALRIRQDSRIHPDSRGPVEAYSCPFADHWHVGPTREMAELEELAEFLRDRHGKAPG